MRGKNMKGQYIGIGGACIADFFLVNKIKKNDKRISNLWD
jgi:hypothetical protein